MTAELTNTVQRFFEAVDNRDWGRAEQLMTDPFFLDYSSFGAGPGSELAPIEILTGWKGLLPGFDSTHHQLGPLETVIDGNTANVSTYVTATHQIAGAEGGELWTVYGRYQLKLVDDEGWKLSSLVFNFKFLTGNPDLPKIAQSRANQ